MILEKLVSIWRSLCDAAFNQVGCLIFCGKIGTLVRFLSFMIALDVVKMELVFFIAACVLLCFKFVTKTVLMITQKCFSYCWTVLAQNQSFHGPIRLGVNERLGGSTAATADTNWLWRYSPLKNLMFSNKTEGIFHGSWAFFGWWEVESDCLCITCWVFPFVFTSLSVFISNCKFSSLLPLWFSTPVLLGEKAIGQGLSCWGFGCRKLTAMIQSKCQKYSVPHPLHFSCDVNNILIVPNNAKICLSDLPSPWCNVSCLAYKSLFFLMAATPHGKCMEAPATLTSSLTLFSRTVMALVTSSCRGVSRWLLIFVLLKEYLRIHTDSHLKK